MPKPDVLPVHSIRLLEGRVVVDGDSHVNPAGLFKCVRILEAVVMRLVLPEMIEVDKA